MRKHIGFVIYALLIALCSGCGHSVLLTSKMTGFHLAVPLGEGQYIGLTLGSEETTAATVRGGSTVESTTVAGGGVFSGEGGVNHITRLKTNAQLNEGNMRDVLMSPDCPEAVKVMLASNLVSAATAPDIPVSVVQSQTASIHSGIEAVTSNSVPIINRVSGVDKIVDDVTSSVTTVTEDLVEATSNVAESTYDKIAKWIRSLKWKAILGIILFFVMPVLIYKIMKVKKDKPLPPLDPTDPDSLPENPSPGDDPNAPIDVTPVIVHDQPKKETSTKKMSWLSRLFTAIGVIWSLFLKIPPEKRREIIEKIKSLVVKRKKSK